MSFFRYTLVTDGSSDRILRYLIDWLLERLGMGDVEGTWADPRIFRAGERPRRLRTRLAAALESYPCDVLFVHRDAERQPRADRVAEIREAVTQLLSSPPAVCVVPVRMTEAWLLIDESALRQAAGNPTGRAALGLPAVRELEDLPDPKEKLFDILRKASERRGRRRRRGFSEHEARLRLGEFISDFSPLEILPAFQAFRADLEAVLAQEGWI